MFHFYHHPWSPYSQKIFFLLEEIGHLYDLQMVDLEKRAHRTAAYAAINPAQRVPAIKDGAFVLNESNAIMRYLVRRFERYDLYPLGLTEQADVDRWWEFCSHHINKPLMDLAWHKILIHHYGGKPNQTVIAHAEKNLERDLPVLENYLIGRNHLVGPSLTLADINLMPFGQYCQKLLPMDQFPALRAWTTLVGQRQAWRNVVAS